MSKRPPSSNNFEQMLLQQNQMRQAALAQEQANYSAQLEQQRQAAAAQAQAQQQQNQQTIQNKVAQPVKLGTLLTSPVGLLGNPLLSGTKLS